MSRLDLVRGERRPDRLTSLTARFRNRQVWGRACVAGGQAGCDQVEGGQVGQAGDIASARAGPPLTAGLSAWRRALGPVTEMKSGLGECMRSAQGRETLKRSTRARHATTATMDMKFVRAIVIDSAYSGDCWWDSDCCCAR